MIGSGRPDHAVVFCRRGRFTPDAALTDVNLGRSRSTLILHYATIGPGGSLEGVGSGTSGGRPGSGSSTGPPGACSGAGSGAGASGGESGGVFGGIGMRSPFLY